MYDTYLLQMTRLNSQPTVPDTFYFTYTPDSCRLQMTCSSRHQLRVSFIFYFCPSFLGLPLGKKQNADSKLSLTKSLCSQLQGLRGNGRLRRMITLCDQQDQRCYISGVPTLTVCNVSIGGVSTSSWTQLKETVPAKHSHEARHRSLISTTSTSTRTSKFDFQVSILVPVVKSTAPITCFNFCSKPSSAHHEYDPNSATA